jgi:hypothetical protein
LECDPGSDIASAFLSRSILGVRSTWTGHLRKLRDSPVLVMHHIAPHFVFQLCNLSPVLDQTIADRVPDLLREGLKDPVKYWLNDFGEYGCLQLWRVKRKHKPRYQG